MNDQPEQIPLVDPGNNFLGPDYPGAMVCGVVQTDDGPRLVLTVRCGPATVSVTMSKAAAKTWAARIDAAADGMTGLVIPPGGLNGFKLS